MSVPWSNPFHFAVVVGISAYPGGFATLSGPANDATEFREWLVAPDGGGLPAENVRLLQTSDPAPNVVDDARPDSIQIAMALNAALHDLEAAVAAQPDAEREKARSSSRLYIFFAGHGIMPGSGQAALLTARATPELLDNLEISSWLRWFQDDGRFRQVVIFADCCRTNKPLANPGVPTLLRAGRAGAQVFWMNAFATSGGQLAREDVDESIPADERRGYFSRALMEGLRTAVDEHSGLVTPDSLYAYVFSAVVTAMAQRHPGLEQMVEFASSPASTLSFGPPREPPRPPDRPIDHVMPSIALETSLDQPPSAVERARTVLLKNHADPIERMSARIARAGGPQSGLVVAIVGSIGALPVDLTVSVCTRDEAVPDRWVNCERVSALTPASEVYGARLAAGWYTLALSAAGTTTEQSVWLVRGYQTIVVVLFDGSRVRPGIAAVHMGPIDSAWSVSDPATTALERAYAAREEGQSLASRATASVDTPIGRVIDLDYLGAACVTAQGETKASNALVDALAARAVSGPDVVSVRAAVSSRRRPSAGQVSVPPLLSSSYDRLLAADTADDSIIVNGSAAERIAAVRLIDGFWLTWSRPQPAIAPSSPIRRRPAAAQAQPVSDDFMARQRPVGGHLAKWMVGRDARGALAHLTARSDSVAVSKEPYRELQGRALSVSDARLDTASLGAFYRVNAFLEDVATVNELPTAADAIAALGPVEIAHRLGLPVAVVDSAVNILR